MERFHKGVNSIGRYFGVSGAVFLGAMAVLMGLDVLLRFILNSPILGSYELVELLMLLTIASALSYTQYKKGHVAVTFITDYFPKKLQHGFKAFCLLLEVVVVAVLTFASFRQGINSFASKLTTSVLFIPVYPFYFFLSLGFLAFTLILFADTIYRFWLLGQPSSEK